MADHAVLLGVLLISSVLTFIWIMRANRTIPNRTMHEVGFRAMRLRLYVAGAGVVWMLCVPSGLALYVVFRLVPRLRDSAELLLWVTILIVGLLIPLLIIRSANLAHRYRK